MQLPWMCGQYKRSRCELALNFLPTFNFYGADYGQRVLDSLL